MSVPATPAGSPAGRNPIIHHDVGDHDVRNAWVSAALLPVSFTLAMIVGEALLALQGYQDTGDTTVPVGAVLVAGVPALLVLVSPAVAAVVYGVRAYRHGHPAGAVPAVLAALLAAASLTLNVVAYTLAY